ncbi:ArsR family transcriptional regulator [Salinisphaera orenii MK-B5]|uniref:ArsR family transcriptional regulator n=1 Tax=Salinisphaera orenii MK-B5 TaxID=856730 RepID=A0A423PV99_9GAMM|nr:arsenate reductase ArsC [Salinisphaera orenii]ROO29499.1 ArsR family transcriptional regulator [Salinisphaera orenii MK-B5]
MSDTDRTYNVLFLCRHNSARSIFGEALLNSLSQTSLRGFSAGSEPGEHIHPLAAELLASMQIAADALYPKHWDVFTRDDAPAMDFVFSVCDVTLGQTCPTWPGHPVTAHWGIDDPSQVEGDEAKRRQAFRKAFYAMRARIQLFANLPIASLDRIRLQSEVDAIGRMESTDDAEADA